MFTLKNAIFITALILIATSLTTANEFGLSQIELREKYGQVGTSFNDGKSCYRTCDGEIKTCHYEFHVQYFDAMNSLCGDCENGTLSDCFQDGCITANGVERVFMTVNQKLPGPAINVCKGDRIIVDVTNHMAGQGLTLHWHGMRQERTPWMDGVPMVTQCPINTGNSFRYAFYASEAGTFAWHAHSGVHRANGVVGTLVIREAYDPNANLYDYDLAQHNVLLFDWDNHLAEDNDPGIRSVISSLPNSVLINGHGGYHDLDTDEYKFAPMAVFYVQRGKRHRFRIANIGVHVCPFGVTIGGHKMIVIAADAHAIEPLVVDSFACSPGERYDVVINATCDPSIAETLLTIRALGGCTSNKIQEFARIIFVDNIFNHPRKYEDQAPLTKRPSYDSVSVAPPAVTLNYPFTNCKTPGIYCIAAAQQKKLLNSIGTNLRNVKPFEVIPLCFDLIPIHKRPFVYKNTLSTAKVAAVNNIAFASSPVPGLTQDDSNVGYCNVNNLPEKYDVSPDGQTVYYCPHLIQLKLDKVYELLLTDNTTATSVSHPIHLHGNTFEVLDMGTYDEFISGKTAFADAKYPPVIKDTACIPKRGFLRIRFRTSNPGYWTMHCHFEDHIKPGMMLVIKVGDKKDMRPPPPGFPTCGNYLAPVF